MKIVHKRADGGVSITTLAKEMSLEDVVKHAEKLEKELGFVSSRVINDDSLIPSDREFRNAWTDDQPTDTVDIDITKAQEIKKNQFRAERKPKLEALDVEVMKALEVGADISELVTKKQELRDVTKIALPTNIDELKSFKPDCLKG